MEKWIEDNQCTACGACFNACPKNAITMKPDVCGFERPEISTALCVNCGRCEQVCPILHPVPCKENTSTPLVYAGWSLDESTRYHSTSGGVFSELARLILADDGVIIGAVYDDNQLVYHTAVFDQEGLDRVRQSKYLQSQTRDAFRQAKSFLEQGRKVMICATPCQIAGLRSYLGKEYPNLFAIDFICRGSNSPKAYRKWLDMLEHQYRGKVTRVWFKNKELGWNRFSTRVDFDNGKTYRKDRYNDLFMRGYLEKNLYIRPCCSACQFKSLPRMSDITLADFWGVEKTLDADKGTSMLLINNERGQQLVEAAGKQIFLMERTLEEAEKGNQMLNRSAWISKWSTYFLESLDRYRFDKAFYRLSFKLRLMKWKVEWKKKHSKKK